MGDSVCGDIFIVFFPFNVDIFRADRGKMFVDTVFPPKKISVAEREEILNGTWLLSFYVDMIRENHTE